MKYCRIKGIHHMNNMMTSSNGNIFYVTGPLCGEFTGHRWIDSTHKSQWRGALMFSLICAWLNSWVNNRQAGDLRRHRVHYDVKWINLKLTIKPQQTNAQQSRVHILYEILYIRHNHIVFQSKSHPKYGPPTGKIFLSLWLSTLL